MAETEDWKDPLPGIQQASDARAAQERGGLLLAVGVLLVLFSGLVGANLADSLYLRGSGQ